MSTSLPPAVVVDLGEVVEVVEGVEVVDFNDVEEDDIGSVEAVVLAGDDVVVVFPA